MHPLYPSPRVSQLDSNTLDGELFSLLKQQLAETFQHLSGKSWSYSQKPELWSLFLKLAIFKLTVAKHGSTYGLKLQNLKFSNAKTGNPIGKTTKILFLAMIFGQYGIQKLQSSIYSANEDQSHSENSALQKLKSMILRRKTEVLRLVDGTIKLLELTNFLAFLIYGKFPNLIHRALGVTLTPVLPDLLKFSGENVSFEFQNRQLVWNVLTEFLVFILPLIKINKVKKVLKKFIAQSKRKESAKDDVGHSSKFAHLHFSQCAICIENKEMNGIKIATTQVTNPFITNCGHIFCYICLATRFNCIENDVEGAEFCPRCSEKLTTFEDYARCDLDIDITTIVVPYETTEDATLESEHKSHKSANRPSLSNSVSSAPALVAVAEQHTETDTELLEEAHGDILDGEADSFDDADESGSSSSAESEDYN